MQKNRLETGRCLQLTYSSCFVRLLRPLCVSCNGRWVSPKFVPLVVSEPGVKTNGIMVQIEVQIEMGTETYVNVDAQPSTSH